MSNPETPSTDTSKYLSQVTPRSSTKSDESFFKKSGSSVPQSEISLSTIETLLTPLSPLSLSSASQTFSSERVKGNMLSKEDGNAITITIDTDQPGISGRGSGGHIHFERSAGFASEEFELLGIGDPHEDQRQTIPIKTVFQDNVPTFMDGKRSVDYVLVWDLHNLRCNTEDSVKKRQIFEANLSAVGLQLEYEEPEKGGLAFVKIHAPLVVLRHYSEVLKLRMPIKEEICPVKRGEKLNPFLKATMHLSKKVPVLHNVRNKPTSVVRGIGDCFHRCLNAFQVSPLVFPPVRHQLTAIYSRDREYLFDVNSPDFFTPVTCTRIISFILARERYREGHHDSHAFGIQRLISENAYVAAYPLHDGTLKTPGCNRKNLFDEWASLRNFFKTQPLDYIKEYFGVKIALYFAWLGFYTHMLIPASIVGILCFIYSCATLWGDVPSNDICNLGDDVKMCPMCDKYCDYYNLKNTCLLSKVTYFCDNPATVFFAVFMSFWGAVFLEMWKRYSAEITHRWDVTNYDLLEEHPRPEYLARLKNSKKFRINVITNTSEPRVKFWSYRIPATFLSFSSMLFLILIALSCTLGVVFYRMSTLTALFIHGKTKFTSYVVLFTSVTAAVINLAFILVIGLIYGYIAEFLTEIELLRTETEFSDSVTLKMYMLDFVNYYSSIFYIAFFKGAFVGRPGSYTRIFSYRLEECVPGGCVSELFVQLSITMIGKQIMNGAMEMVMPILYQWYNALKFKPGLLRSSTTIYYKPQWLKDFKLIEWTKADLYYEYLEMILQYGFVTIFVAAFPLAPFFALLNNGFEMRLDAQKLLLFYRRPDAEKVRSIGVWFTILDFIGKLSVITNGLIIGFTSSYIPKIVYIYTISEDYSLKGYLNFSLAYFNTSDFDAAAKPNEGFEEVDTCRYAAFHEPPGSREEYGRAAIYWNILAARLAFFVVFENFVAILIIIVRWCAPDIPADLRHLMRREAFITNEVIIKQEKMRALSFNRSIGEDNLQEREARSRLKSEKWSKYSDKNFHPIPVDEIRPTTSSFSAS